MSLSWKVSLSPVMSETFTNSSNSSLPEISVVSMITSSPRDYVSLRRVIVELDRSRRQVFIEAVVMELSPAQLVGADPIDLSQRPNGTYHIRVSTPSRAIAAPVMIAR